MKIATDSMQLRINTTILYAETVVVSVICGCFRWITSTSLRESTLAEPLKGIMRFSMASVKNVNQKKLKKIKKTVDKTKNIMYDKHISNDY